MGIILMKTKKIVKKKRAIKQNTTQKEIVKH